ncbi:MAG: exodeoxyribonuclease III [Firmicutes bacterium]|jgi:exodeoxyribonuclease-3|nr:exodeoxyribonuclease III [Bacillota bacterium]
MKFATWNVNSLRARTERVQHWLSVNTPDVLCLQETKCSQDSYPADIFSDLGYESAHYGLGQWNGVALVSKLGLEDVEFGFLHSNEPITEEARLIRGKCGKFDVWSAYIPNGRIVGSDHYEAKLVWLKALKTELEMRADQTVPLLLCGDFNIAPRDSDVFDIEMFAGATHVTERERLALNSLLDWGLFDLAIQLYGEEADLPFTWWDYRGGSFHKNLGMRIDLMLGNKAFLDIAEKLYVDREARKKGSETSSPSDHTPVVVETKD